MTGYQPGDPEYRAFVGPFEQYDVMGATQFSLLYSLGIRQHHRLLDVGCGSLRSGRLFITYLEPGNYTGVEPNTWLVDDAIAYQTGRSLIDIKAPVFSNNDGFDFSDLGMFDSVIAQSIASHAGPSPVARMLASIRSVLVPTGLAAVTSFMPIRRIAPSSTSSRMTRSGRTGFTQAVSATGPRLSSHSSGTPI